MTEIIEDHLLHHQEKKLQHPDHLPSIPADLMRDTRVSRSAKTLYPYLCVFSKKYGYCWAGNQELAEMLSVPERTLKRWIKNLSETGWIFLLTGNEPYKSHRNVTKILFKKSRKIFIDNEVFKKFTEGPFLALPKERAIFGPTQGKGHFWPLYSE